MKIYKLVLPVHTFFSRRFLSAEKVALLLTCKLINQEAYPLFLSLNNFDIDFALPLYYPPPHDFYKHVREVTFEWYPKGAHDNDGRAPTACSLNVAMIKQLYKFPKLQILHIAGYWDGLDPEYPYLQYHYKEEGVMQTYLERTGFKAFLGFPGINKIELYQVTEHERVEELVALGKYMTKHLGDFKSGSLNF